MDSNLANGVLLGKGEVIGMEHDHNETIADKNHFSTEPVQAKMTQVHKCDLGKGTLGQPRKFIIRDGNGFSWY